MTGTRMLGLMAALLFWSADSDARASRPVGVPRSPEVVHTGRGPTGYAVTFRYRDPAAKRVRIKGEWSFVRPSALPRIAGTPDHPVIEGQDIRPADWRPGDVPLQHPNSTGPRFPVADMVRGRDGVWSYTTPLPSGVFTYSFIVDCFQPDETRCTSLSDPANRPWNERGGARRGSVAPNSQVFVPSDARFDTVDYGWQGPSRTRGRLTHETYASPGHVTPRDENYLVVYTPPGYDPNRAKPYPTLWLSHGGGENEMGWTTQGAAADILDNLVVTGQIEPVVVVMPNGAGFPPSVYAEAYDRDLIDRMLPFVETRYHVSRSPDDRAFSGLSMGGTLTNSFLVKHPEVFRYYGVMSAGLPESYGELTPAQTAALKGKVVWVGGGWQDVIHAVGFGSTHTGPIREIGTLVRAGVPVTTAFVHGGHEWYVWRLLLRDFLTRSAFLPPPYADRP